MRLITAPLYQEAALAATQTLIVNIVKVITVVESVKAGSLTSGSEVTSVEDILTALLTFVIKVTVEAFDAEYTSALTVITSVTKVINFPGHKLEF